LFERFIDITRNDLPDIDLDFSDQNRHLVFEYMEEKYGKDHVARLGTVALYRPRSAIEEAGTALGVPKWLCTKVLDSLIIRSSGDSRALNTLEDTFTSSAAGKELMDKYPEILVAAQMEGHPRHYSQHAAGIVVTAEPVTEYVAVDARTGATQCDKKDAEDLNLLKIDALGLTQLSSSTALLCSPSAIKSKSRTLRTSSPSPRWRVLDQWLRVERMNGRSARTAKRWNIPTPRLSLI
jgi:DNA polymerase III alpha subunit